MKQEHKNKVSDEELIEAYNIDKHIGKLKVKFNLPDITIWRRLKDLGIKSSAQGGKKIDLSEILDGQHPYYQTYKLKNRLLAEGLKINKCEICNISEWNNKSLNCQLDHINGVPSDHRLDNLRMICPNCHSQTETFCGRNK